MNCHCSKLHETEEALPVRDEFINDFTLIEKDIPKWNELYKCNICDQYWIVEKGRELNRQSNKAFKIESNIKWKDFNTLEPLKKLLIRLAGGTTKELCNYNNCKNQRLLNKAFCVIHSNKHINWTT